MREMMFYKPIRRQYGKDQLELEMSSYIYGPFETNQALLADVAVRFPSTNSEPQKVLIFEATPFITPKNILEKPEEKKRVPDERNWHKVKEHEWRCNLCDAVILAVTVAHPIWDGPFPASGSGECSYSEVGYCPNCDKKPSSSGAPITPR